MPAVVRSFARPLVAALAIVAVGAFALIAFLGFSGHGASAASPADHCASAARSAGFTKDRAVKAVAIGMAESSCRDNATNRNGPTSGCPHGSTDRGLWQINGCYHPGTSVSCAFNAVCNAKAAYQISSGGTNWRPWSTNGGPYLKWMSTARAAVNRVYSGGGGNPKPPNPPKKPTPNPDHWPTASYGNHGERVVTLQLLLRARGYSLSADGSFGPITRTKLRSFQSAHRLAVDGVAGPKTWSSVVVTVQMGSKGSAVTALQRQLRAHGYSVTVDGQFGPKTRQAVRTYQSRNHLAVDGVVGPKTWSSLVH